MDFENPSQKNIPWKLIALGAGVLVLIIVIVVIVFRVVGSDNEPITLIKEDVILQAETLIKSCADADDQEGCEEGANKDAAILTGSAAYCGDLAGDTRDDCLLGVAREVMDLKACSGIESETIKTLCQDTVSRELASANKDVTFCDQLSTQKKIDGCHDSLGEPVTTENCSQSGHDVEYCDFIEVSDQAAAANDRSLCKVLSDEYEASCEDLVLVDDADADGLYGVQEAQYGTDPYNADTDGDGYSDLDEIEAGYNPTGDGQLE
jgi:hypothetical protein